MKRVLLIFLILSNLCFGQIPGLGVGLFKPKIQQSIDGQYPVVGIYSGTLYKSTDWGVSFNSIGAVRKWWTLAISSDSKYQLAGITGNFTRAMLSTDYGITWNSIGTAFRYGMSNVSMSYSGKYQLTVGQDWSPNYTVQISTDYGATWATIFNDSNPYSYSAISGDGKYQIIIIQNYYIKLSIDYGISWNFKINTLYWASAALNYNGQYQTVVASNGVQPGAVYRTSDYGTEWSSVSSMYGKNNKSVAISSDGKYQTIAVMWGYLYRSTDYGITWAQVGISSSWTKVDMSASGKYQFAQEDGGFVYRSDDYGATWVKINSPSGIYCMSVNKYNL